MRLSPLCVLAPVLLAGHLSAADLVVGPPGSGAAFNDLQVAIDAAVAGQDRVLVLAGTYAGSFTIDKDVDVIGAGTDAVIEAVSDAAPALSISGIGAGERVTLGGLRFAGAPQGGGSELYGVLVRVANSSGPIVLAGLVLDPASAASGSAPLLEIASSDVVVMDDCTIAAAPQAGAPAAGSAAVESVRVTGSRVWINGSRLVGRSGQVDAAGALLDGAPALLAAGSTLDIAWSRFDGGAGAGVDGAGFAASNGGPAVALTAVSRLDTAGGVDALLQGGAGGFGAGPGGASAVGGGASGLALTGGSLVILSGGVAGGADGQGQSPAPPFSTDPSSTVFFSFEPLTVLRTLPTLVAPGDDVTIELTGLSVPLGLFYGTQLGTPFAVPGYAGEVLIDPMGLTFFGSVTVGPFSGSASVDLTIPSGLPAGFVLYLQAATLGPATQASISAPATIVVGA